MPAGARAALEMASTTLISGVLRIVSISIFPNRVEIDENSAEILTLSFEEGHRRRGGGHRRSRACAHGTPKICAITAVDLDLVEIKL